MNGLVNLARLNLEPISATHKAFKKWQRNYPFASTKRCDCNSSKAVLKCRKNIVYVVGKGNKVKSRIIETNGTLNFTLLQMVLAAMMKLLLRSFQT
jgi:hypothetical protein